MAEYVKHGLNSVSEDIRACFPDDNWSLYKIRIPGTLTDVGKEGFSKKVIRQIVKQRDWEDDKDAKRFVKSVPSRIESETIDAADTLLSVFVEERCKRGDKVKTTVIEDVETPEYKESPLNVDFVESPSSLQSTRECVVCIEHKNRETDPYVRCGNCNGTGVVKCENCDGSGRVRDFAETTEYGEKERSFPCPECGGRGRIPCSYCNGEGRVAVFAREYTLRSTVEETVQYKIEGYYWNPWGLWKYPFEYSRPYDDLSKPEDLYDWRLLRLAKSALQETFECVSYRNKNRKQVEIDNRLQIESLMRANGYSDAYRENLALFKNNREDDGAMTVSLREQHYVIPAKRLSITIKGKHTIDLLICQLDEVSLQVFSSNLEWGLLNVGEYFFFSIYYSLVRLGRAAYKLVVKP